MSDLTEQQINDWREALSKTYGHSAAPEMIEAVKAVNMLCDMALREAQRGNNVPVWDELWKCWTIQDSKNAALRIPLQPQLGKQEPAAWYDLDQMTVFSSAKPTIPGAWTPLYTSPQPTREDGLREAAKMCEQDDPPRYSGKYFAEQILALLEKKP